MKIRILFILLIFAMFCGFSQVGSTELWEEAVDAKPGFSTKESNTKPSSYKSYKLNFPLLTEYLKSAPSQRSRVNSSNTEINFPNEDGVFKRFKISEASVMAPELQEKYKLIKSYVGISVDDSNETIRFSLSPLGGFNAIILNDSDSPTIIKKDGNNYQVYSQKEEHSEGESFGCGATEQLNVFNKSQVFNKMQLNHSNTLRVFRMALVSSGSFSVAVLNELNIPSSADEATKKTAVMSYLVSVMTTVNAIYERDVAVSMELVSNNDAIIFLDPATDGLDDVLTYELLNQGQQVCDANIGIGNFDLGHTLTVDTGLNTIRGIAQLGSVCGTNSAKGASSRYGGTLVNYTVLSHEIGHQFGANHTWNTYDGVNGHPLTGVESGNGQTIMSYGYGPRYFHSVSIEEIDNFITNQTSCSAEVITGNNAPVVNAGSDYVIPISTPYILEGSGSDIDGTNLTYTWEQIDPENYGWQLVSTKPGGPISEWIPPTSEPIRYMPNLFTVLTGYIENETEVLPSVSRTLNYALVARDNDVRGGLTAIDKMSITVGGNSAPFKITSQNNEETWFLKSSQTITWDVSGTDSGTINTPTVDIFFSKDGGVSYPIVLASNIPNNGSYNFEVPQSMNTERGRVMVRGHNNIFFDVNDVNIKVKESFTLSFNELEKDLCVNNSTTVEYDFTYKTNDNSAGTVTFSGNGLSGAVYNFNPSTVSQNNTSVKLTISNIGNNDVGENDLNIIGTSSNTNLYPVSENIVLNVYDTNIGTVGLTAPSNNAIGVEEFYNFEWEQNVNANAYLIQIATDNSFSNLIESSNILSNSFYSTKLSYNTIYYWRVKPINACGEGDFSIVSSFNTISEENSKTYVPDNNFEQALINLGYDDVLDDFVLTTNIKGVTGLNVSDKDIYDLTGIKGFVSLLTFTADNNYIDSIDLTRNTKLSSLSINNNLLTSIDLSKNLDLTRIFLYDNKLQSLDLANNNKLFRLWAFNNEILNLNLENLTELNELALSSNRLSEINISNNTKLKTLRLNNNYITTIDLSKNTLLTDVYFHENALTSINLYNNLELSLLSISINPLSSLDLSKNIKLKQLWCTKNNLAQLDVSNNVLLTNLSCGENLLNQLNLSGLNLLSYLQCDNNLLTDIDVSENLNLEVLNAYYNKLTEIDVSNNSKLWQLAVNDNNLRVVDVSENKVLNVLSVQRNNLEVLNVKNGNNFNNGGRTVMVAIQNPNLTCIQVDDPAASAQYFNWEKDPGASYSESCTYDGVDLDNDGISYVDDLCPDTATGEPVDANGCSESQKDDDNDGVMNNVDNCPDTPIGETVDANGCAESQKDDDNDGVMNNLDDCPNTPTGESIDANGCSENEKDDDGDGVMNIIDVCSNTPAGSVVNTDGCLKLSSNNFSIETIGETCPDKDNAQIIITAQEAHDYVVTMNGVDYNFTNNLTVDNLVPGTYEFCISVISENFEQCFGIELSEGTTVSGKSSVVKGVLAVSLDTGTAPYKIELNGVEVLKTYSQVFEINVENGDLVEIKTSKVCEGTLNKNIELADFVKAYPNPTNGTFEIALPINTKEVNVEIYSVHAMLVSKEQYTVSNGKLELNINKQPQGVYFVKVLLNEPVMLKIIKE